MYSDHLILLNARSIFAIFLCNWMQCVDGFSLCNKVMLENVTTQRTQQFSAFVCYWKNLVKCSACAVARKIENDCYCRNLPISDNLVVRISRNLAKRIVQKPCEWSIMKKSEFWHTCREFLIIQKTIYGKLWNRLPVCQISIEQCWQKGFNVNL